MKTAHVPMYGLNEDRALTTYCKAICDAGSLNQLESLKYGYDRFLFPQWTRLFRYSKYEAIAAGIFENEEIIRTVIALDRLASYSLGMRLPAPHMQYVDARRVSQRETLRLIPDMVVGTSKFQVAEFLLTIAAGDPRRSSAFLTLKVAEEYRKERSVNSGDKLWRAKFLTKRMAFWDEHPLVSTDGVGAGDAIATIEPFKFDGE